MVKWVRKKINFGGMIEKPVTFHHSSRFAEAQQHISIHNYTFTSFPIVDDEGRLVGLLTRDEMEFAEDRNPCLSASNHSHSHTHAHAHAHKWKRVEGI